MIINGYREFHEYLSRLDGTNKPFDCPNLKILPENLEITNIDLTTKYNYKKGALICSLPNQPGESHECRLKRTKINLNEQGELEILCAQNCKIFKLKIIE